MRDNHPFDGIRIMLFCRERGCALDATDINGESAEPPAPVKTVAAGILGEFLDALAKEEGLGDASTRLRKTVLDDGVFAEPSIRAAMFPDAS